MILLCMESVLSRPSHVLFFILKYEVLLLVCTCCMCVYLCVFLTLDGLLYISRDGLFHFAAQF